MFHLVYYELYFYRYLQCLMCLAWVKKKEKHKTCDSRALAGWLSRLECQPLTPKGCAFIFQSGHVPGLWVQSAVGVCMGGSQFLSLFPSVFKINKHILRWSLKKEMKKIDNGNFIITCGRLDSWVTLLYTSNIMDCYRNRMNTCVIYIYIDYFCNFIISPGDYLKGDCFSFMSDSHTSLIMLNLWELNAK